MVIQGVCLLKTSLRKGIIEKRKEKKNIDIYIYIFIYLCVYLYRHYVYVGLNWFNSVDVAEGYLTNSELEAAVKAFGKRCSNISKIYR